jgi:hypothetical protein
LDEQASGTAHESLMAANRYQAEAFVLCSVHAVGWKPYDEVDKFRDARYITSSESTWPRGGVLSPGFLLSPEILNEGDAPADLFITIIWDEAPMTHRPALEAIERTLQKYLPFGGDVFLMMGDFRQVLPVVPRANRSQIVRATHKKSTLWPVFQQLALTVNMRVELARRRGGNPADIAAYSSYLMRVGDGTEPVNENHGTDLIRIPDNLLLPSHADGEPGDLTDLIGYTFGDMPAQLPPRPPLRQPHEGRHQQEHREQKQQAYDAEP